MNEKILLTAVQRKYLIYKRFLDIFISAIVLVVLILPILLILALVYLDDPGPTVFKQKRVGRNGKLFTLRKICTMRSKRTSDGTEQNRITNIGRALRKSSADELLQLFNILRGDMSLVGPRPLVPEEGAIHENRMRCGVYALRPGLTGLAQIHGRDRLNADEKLQWDTEYLRNVSLNTDARILWKTIAKVLRCEDIQEK